MKKLLIFLSIILLCTNSHAGFGDGAFGSGGGGGGSDNLGNHTATEDLDMDGNSIDNLECEAYDATNWNSSTQSACKDAVRDKIESLSLSSGGWTSPGSTVIYATSDTSDLVIGGTDITNGSFWVDESAGIAYAQGGFKVGDESADANATVFTVGRLSGNVTMVWDETAGELQVNKAINVTALGQSILARGLVVNNGSDNSSSADFIVRGDSVNVIEEIADDNALYGLGYWDLSGATLMLPSTSTVSLNAVGEIQVDNTIGQLIYHDGTSNVVLPKYEQASITIPDITASDDNMLFLTALDAMTVMSVGCRYSGSVTTVAQFSLEDGGGNAMTLSSTPTCVTGSSTVTFSTVTSGGGLVKGEGLQFDTTNTPAPTSSTWYQIIIKYIWAQQ